MDKTIELVNLWGAFVKGHPGGSIDRHDFWSYLNISRMKPKCIMVGGGRPFYHSGLLLKIIGRISRLNMNYANLALEGTGLNQIEEFGILVTILQEKNPKKTEVIYANLFELSWAMSTM